MSKEEIINIYEKIDKIYDHIQKISKHILFLAGRIEAMEESQMSGEITK